MRDAQPDCPDCGGTGTVYVSEGLWRHCECRVIPEAPEGVYEFVLFDYY